MTLSRRAVLGLVPGMVLFRPHVALAQRAGKGPARLGWLSYLSSDDPAVERLREGMRELGHVEGKSFVIVPRFADGDFTRLPRLVDELVNEKIDVLVVRGPSTDYTKPARTRVPIVFVYSGDPVESGFAQSLARPGLNMTGITFMALELSAKRMEVLKELVPSATRVALLTNPEHSGELAEYRVTDEAARRLGAAITRYVVRNPAELARMMDEIRAAKPDAMLVFPDSLTLVRRKEIAEFAASARIPTMYGWTEYVEAGGLINYGPSLNEGFKSMAKFVDRILKGADASAVPIEQATRIALTINKAAAQRLGLTIPGSILVRADRVIE
jgi:putative tryptophan/tyrosine transport system substrate-binding protein